jgi:hypothetical protein
MGRFPIYKRPIQEINNNLYLVHAEYPIDRINDNNLVKDWLGVGQVFKFHRDGTYLFCELIEEVRWEDVT